MLILTRRVGETICIGDDITVTVTQLEFGQVRLAIHAPKSILVHRLELRRRLDAEKLAAASAGEPMP
jgi:carbon storage regulator